MNHEKNETKKMFNLRDQKTTTTTTKLWETNWITSLCTYKEQLAITSFELINFVSLCMKFIEVYDRKRTDEARPFCILWFFFLYDFMFFLLIVKMLFYINKMKNHSKHTKYGENALQNTL